MLKFFTGNVTTLRFFSKLKKLFFVNLTKCKIKNSGNFLIIYFFRVCELVLIWSVHVWPSNFCKTWNNGIWGIISPPSESRNKGVGGISTERKVKGEFVTLCDQPSITFVGSELFLIILPIASKPSVTNNCWNQNKKKIKKIKILNSEGHDETQVKTRQDSTTRRMKQTEHVLRLTKTDKRRKKKVGVQRRCQSWS